MAHLSTKQAAVTKATQTVYFQTSLKISSLSTIMDSNSVIDTKEELDLPVPIEGESEAVERISKLVEDAASMQKLAEEKTKATEQYFNTLRERLHNSTTFLSNIKKDIENIKLSFQTDEGHDQNSASYWEYNDKTDEELDQEMDRIKDRLKELQSRVQTVKDDMNNTDSFETTMKKTVNILENVSKGIFDKKFE